MYTFAQIKLPASAVEKAKDLKVAPDSYYCMALLNATGVVCGVISECIHSFLPKDCNLNSPR
jgi:hypothetical protein